MSKMYRTGYDDGGVRSVRVADRPSVESQPVLVDSVFEQAMFCPRCYGKHTGFTCPSS